MAAKAKQSIFVVLIILLQMALSACATGKKIEGFSFVEGGDFMMGTAEDEGDDVEFPAPAHSVNVESFYIGTHEVTQAEYIAVMGKTGLFQNWQGDDLPAIVYWHAAIEYCYQRSKKEGLTPCYSIDEEQNIVCDFSANGYRLPTEAEWEYAARGGKKSKGYRYSGSDDIDSVAWYGGNFEAGVGYHAVMTKEPNELGLYDMSGNAAEWCWDFVRSYEMGKMLADERWRVVRGGEYLYNEKTCRVSRRDGDIASNIFGGTAGFRVVRSCK